MLAHERPAGSVCSLSPFLRGEGWGEGLMALVVIPGPERSDGARPSPPPSQPKSGISDFGQSIVTELG
jgi:hypothetical protein